MSSSLCNAKYKIVSNKVLANHSHWWQLIWIWAKPVYDFVQLTKFVAEILFKKKVSVADMMDFFLPCYDQVQWTFH